MGLSLRHGDVRQVKVEQDDGRGDRRSAGPYFGGLAWPFRLASGAAWGGLGGWGRHGRTRRGWRSNIWVTCARAANWDGLKGGGGEGIAKNPALLEGCQVWRPVPAPPSSVYRGGTGCRPPTSLYPYSTGGHHAHIVFTNRLFYVEKGEVVDHFAPRELAAAYADWTIVRQADKLISCAQDGRPHRHSVEEVVAMAVRPS